MVCQQSHERKPLQMSSAYEYTYTNFHYGKRLIKNSENEKLLGVTVDANLNFNLHLENILKKPSKKVHVLARITPLRVSLKENY